MASTAAPQLSKPLLAGLDKETVIAGLSVVSFIALSKCYNIFFATSKEQFTDLQIAKAGIIGVLACVLTKASVTALFEHSIDISSAVSFGTKEAVVPQSSTPPGIPKLTRLVR